MRKSTKTWLIIAAALILLGGILFVSVMTTLKWDFKKLSTARFETTNHEISEEISSISIDADTADIRFLPAEGETCSVVCYEQENLKHTVAVKDGTLTLKVVDTRKWYEHIGFQFESPKITVYLPAGDYATLSVKSDTGDIEVAAELHFESIDISLSTGDVTTYASAPGVIKIATSTGDIHMKDVNAGALALSTSTGDVIVSGATCVGDATVGVTTGKVYLTHVVCENVTTSGDTGNILLKDVIATQKLSIERSTGKVKLESVDAAEILIKTDTGDVTGSLLSEKVFIVNTDTGKIEVPDTVTGGRCEITTDTGDIKITIN